MKNWADTLIYWSLKNFSNLPWRTGRSLYGTLVSEIMLQQTTVTTVLPKFSEFIEKFPDLSSLAKASEEELRHAWKGLGYYRRAKSLGNAASFIFKEFKGKIPNDEKILQTIPGIGPYTSSALISIGMDLKALAVDANVERVLARVCNIQDLQSGKKLHDYLRDQYFRGELSFLKDSSSRNLNEALMDLGREVCTAKKPQCINCPISTACLAYKVGKPEELPKKKSGQVTTFLQLNLARWIVRKNKKVLLVKRPKNLWLENQWELPTTVSKVDDMKFNQYPILKTQKGNLMGEFKTSITKFKISNVIMESNVSIYDQLIFPNQEICWVSDEDLLKKDVTTATQKAWNILRKSSNKKDRERI